MPTENRSSNTEMAAQLSPCPHCGQQDAFVEQLDSDASVVICQGRIDEHSACLARGPVGVQQHECEDQPGHDQAVKEWNKRAAAAPHPDPIAWMVGTAFWWTKEEAERDAAATGLPIVGLGPMSGSAPAEQHQVVPVKLPAYKLASQYNSHDWDEGYRDGWGACRDEIAKLGPLYTHSDPSEVERLREDLSKYIARANDFAAKMQGAQSEAGTLRAQLAERDALLDRVVDHAKFWHDHPYAEVVEAIAKDYKALSASAEPSAPTHDPKLISIVHTPPAEYDEP